jgi:hypothetical protein
MIKFLIFSFIICSQLVMAQSSNFRFKKLLETDPTTPVSFAIKNEGVKTLDYLKENKISPKFITKNWVYVTVSPQKIARDQEKGAISQFHFEFAPPSALNDADTARVFHHVNEVHAGSGDLPQAYTGRNVVMGYVDQGLDWNHPDFRDANNVSRVIRYWDHTANSNASSPAPYGYGQICDSIKIASGTCPYSEITTGHGTTVAGAGSGNGRANGKQKGMAPDSKIIVVETNFNLPNWTLTVADACDYIFKTADSLGLPAVVNLSVGSYYGSHDGKDPASEMMETLIAEKGGRIIVGAAGNGGNVGKYHLHGTATNDTSFVWFTNNPNNQIAPNSVYFDLWADSAAFKDVMFGFGADKPGPNYKFRGYSNFHPGLVTAVQPLRDTIYSSLGNRIAVVEIYTEMLNATFHMEGLITNIDSTNYLFRFATTGSGEYDLWSGAWAQLNNMVTNIPTPIEYPAILNYQLPDSLQTVVSSWNCSDKIISVGNIRNRKTHTNKNGAPYVTADTTPVGKLSPNSSKGPSRLGVVKPDISASGDVMLAAAPLPLLNNPANNTSIDIGGFHARNGGTSMASPIIAGIAALYLEKCNTATAADFKRDLINNAFSDSFTGSVPNNAYGFGKADAYKTLVYAADLIHDSVYCGITTPITAVAGTLIDSVLWSNGFSGNPVLVNQEGTYTATIYYNGSCQSIGIATLTVGTYPTAPTTTISGNTLTASVCNNYQWYKNGVLMPGEINQTLTITSGGDYTVATSNESGCAAFSTPINSTLSVKEISKKEVQAFPNPTKNIINLTGILENDELSMCDALGKIIQIKYLSNSVLDLSGVQKGVYFLTVNRKSEIFYLKLIRN